MKFRQGQPNTITNYQGLSPKHIRYNLKATLTIIYYLNVITVFVLKTLLI